MARLNEPPAVTADSLETLRRKMLRQNRDLAKSNNIRALRIRELENECAGMLSENLALRGRILELEKQAHDSEARRIADHALAIKAQLESQLTQWGTLLAGLGLEPPIKRHSPRISRPVKQRLSFGAGRPSPSQRRLRDVARDIEELGHIAENKSNPRKTMNPEQILALRSEADSADSPELGPPPMSKFIDEDPVKVDSPSKYAALGPQVPSPECRTEPPVSLSSPNRRKTEPSASLVSPKRKAEPPVSLVSPKHKTEPPVSLASPKHNAEPPVSLASPKHEAEPPVSVPSSKPEPMPPSPKAKTEAVARQEAHTQPDSSAEITAIPPLKSGSKRKLAAREDTENVPIQRTANENQAPKATATDKQSIRDRAGGKTLKELAIMRKDKGGPAVNARKPLAAKSINSDISSPIKSSKLPPAAELAAVKVGLAKSKASNERSKSRTKGNPPVKVETIPVPCVPPPTTTDLTTPLVEPALLSPSSPEPVSGNKAHRGDTPPPADVSSRRETSRPGRRSRAAISYAEPNLRDKMRRPTRELFDAVAGEGKYSRRSSHADPPASDAAKVKPESDARDSAKCTTHAISTQSAEPEPGSIPASPLASKSSPLQDLPSTVLTEKRGRPPSRSSRATEPADESRRSKAENKPADPDSNPDTSEPGDVDVYEFTSSSPKIDEEEFPETKTRRRRTTSSRRQSAAVDSDKGPGARAGNASSRRRSMMV